MTDRSQLVDAIAIGLEYTHSAAASTSRRHGGGAFAEIHGVFDLGGIADHLIDQGWRKVDPAAEIDVEIQWGFKLPDRPAIWTPSEKAARARAQHFSYAEVVSRRVITTAWTKEVES